MTDPTIDSEVRMIFRDFFVATHGIGLNDQFDVSDEVAKVTKLIAQEANKARKRAIIDATGGINYTMPIKSMRSRNTAFKLYAVKYFNTKIKERRERLLGALVNDLPTEGDHSAVSGDLEAQS